MLKRIALFVITAVVLVGSGIAIGLYWPTGTAPETPPAAAGALQPEYRSGPFQVGVEVAPESPQVGKNRLTVVVHNTEGEPVTGAQLRAVAEMPAMGAMPAMQAPAEMAEVEPGIYRGTFDLSMEGSWPLTLRIQKADVGETTLSFDMATGRAGLELSAGGIPLAGAGDQKAPESTAGGEDEALPYRSGPYRFDVDVTPKAPQVGQNTLTVRLRDEKEMPIAGANPLAVAEMPAMGAMPAMQAPAELEEVKPGVYRGTFDLSMEGSWPLTVTLQAPTRPVRKVTFDMATGRTGLELSSGAARVDGASNAEYEPSPPGTVTLDSRRRQLIGVETAEAQVVDLDRPIRAVGQITYDERRLSDVTLKFDAWIGELMVDYVGARVERGEPLFTVYSPELLAAQQEYLELMRRRGTISKPLLKAAYKRLTLWDMTPKDIEELERRGTPVDYVTIYAPQSGTVVEKHVVEGSALQAGETVMRIADLSRVWVEADVYETELPLVKPGMQAEIQLPYVPGHTFKATVDYVYPYLDENSRTGRVRLTLPNPEGTLRPDMYAEVTLHADLGPSLAVPEGAVLIAGESRFVFEDLGDGRLAPRRVKTGQRADGWVEIREGLEPGDEVVTSGNFLIASESGLKAGMDQWQ